MIPLYNKYYERIRSNRNFIATLIFGIIGAGMITLFIEYVLEIIRPSSWWGWMPLFFLISFSILISLAWMFSQRIEKIVTTCYISIDPKTFDSLILTTLQEIPESLELKTELETILKEISRKLNDPIMGEDSDITLIRQYSKKLLDITNHIEDHSTKKIVSTIHDDLNNLDKLCENLIEYFKKNSNIFSPDYKIDIINNGIALKEGILGNEVLKIYFIPNLDKSILYPVYSQIERSPSLSPEKFLLIRDKLNYLITKVSLEKDFLKYGIKFKPIEEIKYWNRLEEGFSRPLIREVTNNRDLLEEINESLGKLRDQLSEEKVE
jgi:hypothetical protein